MVALCSDKLPLEIESALIHRLIEDGHDPNEWTVRLVWASVDVYAVVLVGGEGGIV